MQRSDAKPTLWWAGLAGAALLTISAFGPWAEVLGLVSISGIDVDGGWLVPLGGAAAVVLMLLHERAGNNQQSTLLFAIVAAAVALGFTVLWTLAVFVADTDEDEVFGVPASAFIDPGWGLFAAYLGGGTSLICSFVLLLRGDTPARRAAQSTQGRTPAPPGWYWDPWRQAAFRYYNGREWTHHTRDRDGTPEGPGGAPPPRPPPPPAPS